MRVIVINHHLVSREYWSIHKTGCRDIKRTVQETGGLLPNGRPVKGTNGGRFDSLAEAITATIDDEMVELGYSADDIKVYNCASKEATQWT